MSEPTLQDIFGSGATQDANQIIILKVDLPRLTPQAVNKAESLLTGILLKARDSLPRTSFDTNVDQSIYIETGYPQFAFRGSNNDSYRVDQLTINLAKPDTSATIDPDDY
jgi:hypothetical protein